MGGVQPGFGAVLKALRVFPRRREATSPRGRYDTAPEMATSHNTDTIQA